MSRLTFGVDAICPCKGQRASCYRCGGSGVIVNAVPLARKSDPETSHRAAKDATPRANTHRARALAALRDAGPNGLTDFELAERTGVPQTSIGVRRKELADAGYVEPAGTTRPAPSGSAAMVWRAA